MSLIAHLASTAIRRDRPFGAKSASRITIFEGEPSMTHAQTFFHSFLDSCNVHRANLAFIYRVGEDEFRVTYEKFFEDVLLLARAFKGQKVRKGDKVFLLSDNR